jgi:long-chain acyl-CoA synthetase
LSELEDTARTGMLSALYASERPDAAAIHDRFGTTDFRQLHADANKLANLFVARGLRPGDGVALICSNRAEFVIVLLAALRSGICLTPVNWHLTPSEIAYIAEDSRARLLIVEDGLVPGLQTILPQIDRIFIAPNQQGLDASLAASPEELSFAPIEGWVMLYTSGTTGRPKGVTRNKHLPILPQLTGTFANYDPSRDVALCCGPAYHAAPLLFDIRWPLASGVPIVMLPGWDAREVLRAIERHRVTHLHLVPAMFGWLLDLPVEERGAFDLSSLRLVVHGAAPCSIPIKRAMIDWLGPILIEYYGASETGSGIQIDSNDWLSHPGSVGRRPTADGVVIRDCEGRDLPDGETGAIWIRVDPTTRFSYFNAPDKTASQYDGDYATLGDVGRFDGNGYLYLTGRTAECIISGGVNIYPREVDEALLEHAAVADACVVGVPNAEWGEEVKAVVELRSGVAPTRELASELIAHTRGLIAAFKCPRSIDFVAHLPRNPAGKIARQTVRAPYWAGRETTI